MTNPWESLRTLSRELYTLKSTSGLLSWDQETYMPPKGGVIRAECQAALSGILHRMTVSERFWDLIQESATQTGVSNREKAFLRELRRDVEMARKIPESLATELARTASLGQQAWAQARKDNKPEDFLPLLEKMVGLKKQEAECLGYTEHPYDALLDQYDPGARVSSVKPVLDSLEEGLIPLLGKILNKVRSKRINSKSPHLSRESQRVFNEKVLEDIGFDLKAGRLDESAHPFTNALGPVDVRLTTRYQEDQWLSALYSTLHEGGHGLYEQGLPETDWGTPMGEAASLSIHESQSRFWENCVGRSRAYWIRTLPLAQKHFGAPLSDLTVDSILAQANRVNPSLIRVEADEVTYNLHIALRFSLEESIFSGALAVKDIPEKWNLEMKKRMGITPQNDSEGFLQDVHWSCGLFGYFSTYSMGNLIAAQLYAAMETELGKLESLIERGEFSVMLQWLRNKIHRHGREFSTLELVRQATGRDLDSKCFLGYLEQKYLVENG